MRTIVFVAIVACMLATAVGYKTYSCGTDVSCVLDDNGTLSITGNGAMGVTDPYWLGWKDEKSLIKRVIIGEGVTVICWTAFNRCPELVEASIPSTLSLIPQDTFAECPKLVNVTIANGVKTIGMSAFEECTSLSHVTIPKSVTLLDFYAFLGSGLETVTVPAGTALGRKVFSECNNLTSINFEAGHPNYTSIDGVAFDASKTTLLLYPAGRLNTLYIVPENVNMIEEGAMAGGYHLSHLVIHEGVTIGSRALYQCKNLTYVFYQGSTDPANPATPDIFDSDNGHLHICVPPDYSTDKLGDKNVDNNDEVCKTFRSLFNGCFKGSYNGAFFQTKKQSAVEWESRKDGCKVYQCADASGPKSWSTCNSSDSERKICLTDQCVNFIGGEKDKIYVELDFDDSKNIVDLNMAEVLEILKRDWNVDTSKLKAGTETNSNGHVIHIVFYCDSEDLAISIASSLNALSKGAGCEEGIFCQLTGARAVSNGNVVEGASNIHNIMNYVMVILSLMIIMIF